jgi:hypothetical protein
MKQTAVGLLIQNIVEDQTIKAKSMSEWIMVFEKVKEMEKEQMVKFAEFVATYPDKNRNVYSQILHAKSKYDGAERTIDLLEEYYK